MKRIIRLTESDLTRIVRRVISEQATKLTPENSMVGKTYKFEGKLCKVEKAFKLPNEEAYLVYPSQGCRKNNGIVDGVPGYVYMSDINGGTLMSMFEWSGNDWKDLGDGEKAAPRNSQANISLSSETNESYRRRNYYR